MPRALNILAILLGLLMLQAVLRDAFETVILPPAPRSGGASRSSTTA